ncbi:reverse transcriptase domain-containing protein [Tanacetum coccineum]
MKEHSCSVVNLMVVKGIISYNGIIGRLGVRKLQAVPSIAHGMLKILVERGVITLKSSKLVPLECAVVSGPKEAPSTTKPMIEERIKVAINPKYPEQTVMIGSTLIEEGRNKLCRLLQRNLDIFAWKPADMSGVLRHIAEHRLNVSEGCSPEEGIFLGYKVNSKGLKVCPDKVDVVLSLPSPKCLKDVQKLNEKLASLNRLLAKSAEKSLPFFKTLKKCTKKSDFHWTTKMKKAFKQMKQLIAELPMLTAPMEKEELIVYLAATKETVSAVLVTEREAKQMPIYFVSRALRGPELNYTLMEKLVMALVHASKRLKRYFQAHPIIVIAGQPIQQILSRPKVAGRLQKWSIELGEYAIHYRPRLLVKGQILADFIVKRPEEDSLDTLMEEEEELSEPWILFDATNNEAEYEALIAGLRIAEQMGVKNLQANVDSRLMANQVNGTYVVKKADMIRYLEKVKALAGSFKAFTIKQIPRSENKKADALSKIASISFAHLSKQVSVEELKEKSISEVEVLDVVEKEGDTWMTPIFKYLAEETLPTDIKKARAIRRKS